MTQAPSPHRRVTITPEAPPSGRSGKARLDRISQRAHEIYEQRGGQHGRDIEDWIQAERDIDAEDE